MTNALSNITLTGRISQSKSMDVPHRIILCWIKEYYVPQLIECKAGDFVGISPRRMECISFEFAKLFGTTSKADRITRSSCILVEGEGVGVK